MVNRGETQGVYAMSCFELCWARQHDKENLRKILLARKLQRQEFYDNEAGVFLFFTYLHICDLNFQISLSHKGLTT